jgi:hypothetical protein
MCDTFSNISSIVFRPTRFRQRPASHRIFLLVPPAGFEPTTIGLRGRCSDRLSYRGKSAGPGSRTPYAKWRRVYSALFRRGTRPAGAGRLAPGCVCSCFSLHVVLFNGPRDRSLHPREPGVDAQKDDRLKHFARALGIEPSPVGFGDRPPPRGTRI